MLLASARIQHQGLGVEAQQDGAPQATGRLSRIPGIFRELATRGNGVRASSGVVAVHPMVISGLPLFMPVNLHVGPQITRHPKCRQLNASSQSSLTSHWYKRKTERSKNRSVDVGHSTAPAPRTFPVFCALASKCHQGWRRFHVTVRRLDVCRSRVAASGQVYFAPCP